MQTITPDELRQAIKNVGSAIQGGAAQTSLRKAAIASKRLDLIAACFSSQGAKSMTLSDVEKLPQSDFRTKALLAIIRAPSDYWPTDREEGMVFGVSMLDPRFNILCGPFPSLVEELLPGKALGIETIRYQGRRNKLADELLEAFRKKGGQITPEELEALQSIPQCLNGGAEGGYEDPAYTKIDPKAPDFTMEAYMKAAFAEPEWKPPVSKPPKPKAEPAQPKSSPPAPEQAEKANGGVWLAGALTSLALLVWRWRRQVK